VNSHWLTPEPAGEFLRHQDGVFGGQHGGHPTLALLVALPDTITTTPREINAFREPLTSSGVDIPAALLPFFVIAAAAYADILEGQYWAGQVRL
jgi:hypothetical protein